MKRYIFSCLGFLFFLFPSSLFAEDNQYVTVVNPVRIAPYTIDSAKSIAAEYKVIKDNGLPATWLLTFDVMEDEKAVNALSSFDQKQEYGIFLEVSPALCAEAQVVCNEGSWHHANVIFLSGYSIEDRKKLIDTLFFSFRDIFGYYPKSVGSWWTDAYSLSYMKEKYGIIANLTCSDQFSTDGYQLWGQYWVYPYMPSRYHAGIPGTVDTQLDLVSLQWAPRDPLNGYESSLYSTQDYQTKPLDFDTSYFEKLIQTYGLRHQNSFGHITVGLEGDFNPKDYEGEYLNQIRMVKKHIDDDTLEAITMSQFSEWYRNNNTYTESTFVESLDKSMKSVWYQSYKYRINLLYEATTEQITVRDFRTYHKDLGEPYFTSKNTHHELKINIPSYIDFMNDKNSVWDLSFGKLQNIMKNDQYIEMSFEKGTIILSAHSIIIKGLNVSIPLFLEESEGIRLQKAKNGVTIIPNENWTVGLEGVLIQSLSEHGTNELARKRTKALLAVGIFAWVCCIVFTSKAIKDKKKRLIIGIVVTCLFVSYPLYWYRDNTVIYSVSQSEIDVLNHLSVLPVGNVLVYDHACLGCNWGPGTKPASYANKREYIKEYGKHPVVLNKEIFEEKDLEMAKAQFNSLNIQYIYLVHYEDLYERMPFSPGDFNIEKVYESANGELWRVKN